MPTIKDLIPYSKALTALYVEDDIGIRENYAKVFQEIFSSLDVAKDGQEGLEKFRAGSYDIVITDINMPRMNGIEFLKTVKTHQGLKKIPVVVLTTSKARQDINASFELGAAGYMVKPLDYREFIDAVVTIAQYWRLSELPQ